MDIMSNAPLPRHDPRQGSVERGPDYATSAAHYVTRTTYRPIRGEKEAPRRAAGSEASREQTGTRPRAVSGSEYAVAPELASKGAAASLRHPAEFQEVDPTTERLITAEEAKLSRAGSKAALRSARDRARTLESRETAPEELFESDQGARMAATGAMASTHRRTESASFQEGFPDLTHAISAASISHRTAQEEERGGMEPSRQVAFTSAPPQRAQDEAAKRNSHAAAVIMAKQMYAVMPQARDMATFETSGYPGPVDPLLTGLDPSRPSVNLMSEAERRVAARLAQMDEEQKSVKAYHSARASPRPRSVSSARRRPQSVADMETSSFTRGHAQRTGFARYTLREEENGVASPVEDDAVMEMARKNADDTISAIDRDLYTYTGRPSPAVLREWERRVNERSMAVTAPPTSTFVPMTGSKFEDNPQVRALARSKLQPRLDEIDDRVNEKRAREIEKQLDEAQQKRYEQIQKERDVETLKVHSQLLKLEQKQAKKDAKSAKKKKKDSKGKGRDEAEEHPPEQGNPTEDAGYAGLDGGPEDKNAPPKSLIERERNGESSTAATKPIRREEAEQQASTDPARQPNGTSSEAVPDTAGPQQARQAEEPALGGIVSQWSTSNYGEMAQAAEPKQPVQPAAEPSKQSPNRFSLKSIFSRSGPRDTGNQGSFEAPKRQMGSTAGDEIGHEPEEAPEIQPSQPGQPADAEPQPGITHRSSKFQENL
ncbi:hypothetical protein DIZ76_013878 [Coccidioides immitis]|uniref:Uncharacterized protein n=1 Tax=Coccidioides immitis RMSCC 3703 TaxID=454286 RepID=A0A0J8QXC6_COCIT|nr:hypothetical protein CISG_05823 [Coccidioides immitis RMSCC 3703]TPX24531.1 hypothetical protein DIZ76_013878 [Coccidioides immitis]